MKTQKHIYRTGIACAIALWILTGCGSPEEQAQAYYASGMKYVETKDFPKAAIEFRNALKINENSADAWYGMAMVEQQAQVWDRAYADLVKVLEINPKHLKALSALTTLLAVSGDQKAALKYADTSISLDPQNPDVIAQRASLLYQLNQKPEALAEANKALSLKPLHPGAVIVLATDRIASGDVPAALTLIDAALAAEPKSLGLHLIKLNAAKISGDLVKHEAAIRSIIAAFPEHPEFRSELLTFLSANNRNDDAEKELRSIMAAKPDDTKAAMNMAAFIDRTKGRDAARAELVALSTSQKNSYPFLLAVAELDFQAGRHDDAEKQLRELVLSKGTSDEGIEAQLVLNAQLIARNKITEAETGIAEVLRQDGENTEALKQRASIQINQGKYEQAVADLRQVLSNTKSDANAFSLLGSAYERNGQMELAESALVDATQADANNPAFGVNYASFLVRRGKQDQAQTVLQSIVARFPDNREAMLTLADMYQRMGDWERAAEIGQRLKGRDGAESASKSILGQSLLAQRRYDDVITMLGGGTAKPQVDSYAMRTLVQAYVAANRLVDAESYLATILKDNPNNSDAMVLQSSLLLRQNKNKEAEQRLLDAVKVQPDSMRPYMALALLYDNQNSFEQAVAIIQKGVAVAKDNTPLRFVLAGLYEKAGKIEDAIATYEALYSESSNSMIVANNLASLLADNRTDQASLDRAVELAKVLKNSPVPEFRETLGWTLVASGKYREGVKLLEGGIAALGKYPAAHYHLGFAYAALKKDDLALKQLDAALALNPPAELRTKIERAKSGLKPPK